MTASWQAAFAAAVVIASWVWSASHFVGRLEALEATAARQEASLAVLYAAKDSATAWRSLADVQLARVDRLQVAADAAQAQELSACRGSSRGPLH